MTESTMTFSTAGPEEGFQPYRTVSKSAIISLFLGLISALGFLFPIFLILAFIGLICGVFGWSSIRRFPNELTGKIPAVLGVLLCFSIFAAGVTMHSVIYATEVPDGYERVSFERLKSREGPDMPPDYAMQLNGKDVFIKGYVYPDGQQFGIKQFVLVPDVGTCCFGGQPKLTHMIQVTLKDPLRVEYSMRKRKLAGKIHVDGALRPVDGLGGVYYQLYADYVK